MRRLIVSIALLVVVLATASALLDSWALRNVLDRERFADRASALLTTPEARRLLADELAGRLVGIVAPGSGEIDAPWAASLGLPRPAGRDDVARAIEMPLASALANPAVRDLQRRLLLSLHDAAFRTVPGQGGGVELEESRMILDLRPVLTDFTAALPAEASVAVAAIPADEFVFTVADVPQLAAVREAVVWATIGLPLSVTIGIAAAFVALLAAARRLRAVVGVGFAVTLGGLVALAATVLAEPAFRLAVRPSLAAGLAADVLRESLQDLVSPGLVVVAAGLAVVGLGLLADAAWGRAPRRTRPEFVRYQDH